ncbi:MAG: PDZ domain-containing protein [Planctomycetota bacterium]|nr:MAG: PDZ domain-containing protein [Planctomycetota bacterium]
MLAFLCLILQAPEAPEASELTPQEDLAAIYGERWTPEARAYTIAGPGVVSVDVYGEVRSSLLVGPTYSERTRISQGTGVVIHDSGLVITNAHVAAPNRNATDPRNFDYEVAFADQFGGARYRARLTSLDRETDLALLKIEAKGPFQAIPLGRSDDLLLGEKVIAIGTPYGNSHSLTSGILSGIHRNVEVRLSRHQNKRFSGLIQTDAAINPGNSGGPLLNIFGHLIGINTATLEQADGIGYAIPVDRVRAILDERLLDVGQSLRFWAGLKVEETQSGELRVVSLHPRGPAAQAGLQVDDRILEVSGSPVNSREDYASEFLVHSRGDEVALAVQTDGQEARNIHLRLRPADWRDTYGLMGFSTKRVTMRVRRNAFLTQSVPVLEIERVFANTGAARLGLQKGDHILAVKLKRAGKETGKGMWQPVRSFQELVALVRGPDFQLGEANLWIQRGEQSYWGMLTFDDPELLASIPATSSEVFGD